MITRDSIMKTGLGDASYSKTTPRRSSDTSNITMSSFSLKTHTLMSTRWIAAAILSVFLVCLPVAGADGQCLDHIMTEDGPDISGFDTTLLITMDVQELEEVGKELYVVTWDEAVEDPTSPTDDPFKQYFEFIMENQTMTVTVKESLEGLPDYPDSTNQLKIVLQFPDFSDVSGCTLELDHNIVDDNTQEPTPEEMSYDVTIREDYPVGVTLYDIEVKVTDNDLTSPNNQFLVTVDDNCPLEATGSIYTSSNGNPETVQFKLRSSLDYETTQSYECTVDFTDQGSPPMENSTIIAVAVDDMPDEPPVFTSPYYYAEVLSSTALDDPLVIEPGPIQATDGDTVINSPITYSMDNARADVDGLFYFTLDSDTGEVRLTTELDEDILVFERVSFILTATEENGTMANTVLGVTLPWSPGSWSSLHFEQYKYASQIVDPKPGDQVLIVKAVGDASQDVTYEWQNGVDENFAIDSTTGMITTKQSDITPGPYHLVAVAIAETEPPLEAQTQVNIVVLSPSGDLAILSSVVMTQVDEGNYTDNQTLANINTSKDAGSVCITAADPEDAYDMFDMQKNGETWEVQLKKGLDYETWQQVSLRLKAFVEESACTGPSTSSEELLRNEAMVIVSVTDSNDVAPKFEVPSADEVIAYPKDTALQSVVGPVITLKANDPDTIGDVTYKLSGEGAAGFQVGSGSGAVYVKEEFECSSGCTFTAEASDGVGEATVKITVLELDMNHIFTLTMDNMDVSMVDGALQDLSEEIGAQVTKLYVGHSVSASSQAAGSLIQRHVVHPATGVFRKREMVRSKRETILSIQVHVYTVKDGTLMSLEEFNVALESSSSGVEAQEFTEKQVFTKVEEEPVDTTGLTVAVAVLGALLGVVLLSGIGFFIYKRRKVAERRRGPPASPISTLGRAYPNQGYTTDTIERKGNGLHDFIDLNSSVGRGGGGGTPNSKSHYTSPLVAAAAFTRDSPPLYRSALSQKSDPALSTSGSEAQRGLRRTDPGKPEYYGLSSPSAPPSFERTTSSSRPASSSSSTHKQSSSSGLYPTIVTMNSDKDTSETQKLPMSAFKTEEPKEPAADYETSLNKQHSSSKFGGLKGSPPPKRSNRDSDSDDDDDDDKDEGRTTDEEGKKSVAFKVLVETKEIEAQNMGPAQKAAVAKSKALSNFEANKKKLDEVEEEEEEEEDEEGEEEDDTDGNIKL